MDDVLTDHVPCHKCGYDLHGLVLMSKCPECGTPIPESVESSFESTELTLKKLKLNVQATQQRGYDARAAKSEEQLRRNDELLDRMDAREKRVGELLDRFERLIEKWEERPLPP